MEIDTEPACKMKDVQTQAKYDLRAENFFLKRKVKTLKQNLKRKEKKIESMGQLIEVLRKNNCTNENLMLVMENYFKGNLLRIISSLREIINLFM